MAIRSQARRGVRRLARAAGNRWLHTGPRIVLMTQPTAQLGNFLYEWMHAYCFQARGLDIRCLQTPAMDRWLDVFGDPARRLVLAPGSVRLRDRRERGLHNEFDVSFTRGELDQFLAEFLWPSGVLSVEHVPVEDRLDDRAVLINVRRGDYLSHAHRSTYAFALEEYLVAALALSLERGGEIERIHVVSDGLDWCREHLRWLGDHADRLTFAAPGQAPQAHLAALAQAPRLILANSTFSYWGGYLSSSRHRQPEQVVAPWFHLREGQTLRAAWQLDPQWSVVRDLPSRWALPAEVSDPPPRESPDSSR